MQEKQLLLVTLNLTLHNSWWDILTNSEVPKFCFIKSYSPLVTIVMVLGYHLHETW